MEKLEQNDRVSVSFSQKRGGSSLMVTSTRDLKPDENKMDAIDVEVNNLYNYVTEKLDSLSTVENMKQEVQQARGATAASPYSMPTCPEPNCGAEMKVSKSGKRYVCTNAKWKQEDGEWVNYGCKGWIQK